MAKKVFNANPTDFYTNMCKMMSDYSIAHEGEPAISLEMVQGRMEDAERQHYERMLGSVSSGLQAQECGLAAYEKMLGEN